MLYDSQQQVLDKVIAAFREGKRRILVQAPTGFGKSYLIRHLLEKKEDAMVLTHRKQLRDDFGAKAMMVETFHRRKYDFPALLICDECHVSLFDKVIDRAPKDCVIIGFSATPYRKGRQRSLDELYDTLITSKSPQDLIMEGRLSPFEYYAKVWPMQY